MSYGPPQQPGFPHSYYGYPPPAPQKRGLPLWIKLLLAAFIIGAAGCVLICAGLTYIGTMGPDTKVVTGAQVSERHMQTIRDLGLLDANEQIAYFYSDALIDIRGGLYFFTQDKVVIYADSMVPPQIVVRFEEIADITVGYEQSFFIDSTIWIDLNDGSEVYFPVSSEGGGDRRFYDALVEAWRTKVPGNPEQ